MEQPQVPTGAQLKRTLYVGGLDDGVTRDVLHAAFIPFGELRNVELPLDVRTGKPKGFGFVEFELDEDAEAAIDNMHDSEMFGRVITVNVAKRPGRQQPGDKHKPVWADDFFYRKRLEAEGLGVTDAAMKDA
eukprot:GDKH01000419.1.p1 GENE.GDKH01000419.1~~GDKH01000419.1.p1  ORF type:complete len:132 (-),score=28.99 GDKH01000419.1:91-486(-)